jgi:hypothetical protein
LRTWTLTLLLFSGCATAQPVKVGFPLPANLDVAKALAWAYWHGATTPASGWPGYDGPPPVTIVTDLTCRNSPGTVMSGFGCYGVTHPGCVCVDGDETATRIRVGIAPGQPWSSTAVCHEYLHRWLGTTNGYEDPEHKNPLWQQEGACMATLRAAGL